MRFLVCTLLISAAFSFGYGDGPLPAREAGDWERGFVPVDFWDSMQSGQLKPTDEALLNSPVFARIAENYHLFTLRQTDRSPLPCDFSIPKIIHFIWLGSELPPEAQLSVGSWEKFHPGWQIKIWTDPDLTSFPWSSEKSRKNFYEATGYAEKADILRLEVLYRYGGIYSDTDVICFKSFEDLISSGLQFFAGIEVNYPSKITKNVLHVGTAVMGAAEGSVTIKSYLDRQTGLEEAPDEHILNRTGPGLCSRVVTESLLEDPERVLLLPVGYFYPFPFIRRNEPFEKAVTYRVPETMAIHLWRASWIPKEDLERIKQKFVSECADRIEEGN